MVSDETGEKVGCHETEDDANAQVAALYAEEEALEGEAAADPVLAAVYQAWDKNAANPAKGFAVTGPPPPTEPAESAYDPALHTMGYWRGVLAVEEVETGDSPRREFSAGSLSFRAPPLSIYWQKVTAEGHDNAFIVAKADEVWRADDIVLGDGRTVSGLRGRGQFNLKTAEGVEAYQMIGDGFMRGVSVTVSETQESDVEYVWPEGASADDEMMLMPEKVIFHVAEMIDACLTGQPALKDCFVQAVTDAEWDSQPAEWLPPGASQGPEPVQSGEPADSMRSVAPHTTPTASGVWSSTGNVGRLPDPLPVEVAEAAFAWVSDDGEGGLLHHAVTGRGRVGAASVPGCLSAIAALNGYAPGGVAPVPAEDREAAYRHLAHHLTDAGVEPPPLIDVAEVAAYVTASDELDAALTAGGVNPPIRPPLVWLRDPKLTVPTPATYLDSGRCFGHLAVWGVCHLTFGPKVCVTPPKGGDYGEYRSGTLTCEDGSEVAVGQLTLGTLHAPANLGFAPSKHHYEHTGHAIADVAVGEDRHGIWFSGALRPDVDERKLRVLRASGVSGDWRRSARGPWKLAGALVVNVAGFPVPRTVAYTHDGEQTALVAAGVLIEQRDNVIPLSVADRIARSVGLDHPSRLARARDRVLGKKEH